MIELFTSQGCSDCPAADALLKEYIDKRDVVGLTLPVDYWDYLGWTDTLAGKRNTERQREYAERFGIGALYDTYAERIEAFRRDPPPPDWTGVYEAESK